MVGLRQNILTVLGFLFVRRTENYVTRYRRSIMFVARSVAITKREISRRLRLVMDSLKSVSTRASRAILRVINTFLGIYVE